MWWEQHEEPKELFGGASQSANRKQRRRFAEWRLLGAARDAQRLAEETSLNNTILRAENTRLRTLVAELTGGTMALEHGPFVEDPLVNGVVRIDLVSSLYQLCDGGHFLRIL